MASRVAVGTEIHQVNVCVGVQQARSVRTAGARGVLDMLHASVRRQVVVCRPQRADPKPASRASGAAFADIPCIHLVRITPWR
jgi:hypothetical protein